MMGCFWNGKFYVKAGNGGGGGARGGRGIPGGSDWLAGPKSW